MGTSACPGAAVQASVDTVWEVLADPEQYDRWGDIHDVRVMPPGRAHPGQVIAGWTRGLGRRWPVRITIELVAETEHQVGFHAMLPLGLEARNRITCTPLHERSCRVQFG